MKEDILNNTNNTGKEFADYRNYIRRYYLTVELKPNETHIIKCKKDFNSYRIHDINWLKMFENNQTYINRTYPIEGSSLNTYYKLCECSRSQSRFVCPIFPQPNEYYLITNDKILNITKEQNEILYYLYKRMIKLFKI